MHKAMAWVLMKELEPFHLMFVEEPVLTENEEAFIERSSAARPSHRHRRAQLHPLGL